MDRFQFNLPPLPPCSRDNVALPGLAAHFKKESEEERHHAELLMDYQVGAWHALPGGGVHCTACVETGRGGAALLMDYRLGSGAGDSLPAAALPAWGCILLPGAELDGTAWRSPPLTALAAACVPCLLACLPCLQNLRGGRVKLGSIMMPEMEFSHPEKGGWCGWLGGWACGWLGGWVGVGGWVGDRAGV